MEAQSSRSYNPKPSPTDREKLESLLRDFCIQGDTKRSGAEVPGEQVIEVGPPWKCVDQKTVEGYSGFYAQFVFDDNGKFLRVGIWE